MMENNVVMSLSPEAHRTVGMKMTHTQRERERAGAEQLGMDTSSKKKRKKKEKQQQLQKQTTPYISGSHLKGKTPLELFGTSEKQQASRCGSAPRSSSKSFLEAFFLLYWIPRFVFLSQSLVFAHQHALMFFS